MSTINIAASISHGFTSLNRGASATVGASNDDSLQQFMNRVLTLEVGVTLTSWAAQLYRNRNKPTTKKEA